MSITVNKQPAMVVSVGKSQDIKPVSWWEVVPEPFKCANGHLHEFDAEGKITNAKFDEHYDTDIGEVYTVLVCAECNAGLLPKQKMNHGALAGHTHRTLVLHTKAEFSESPVEVAGFEGDLEEFNGSYLLQQSKNDEWTLIGR